LQISKKQQLDFGRAVRLFKGLQVWAEPFKFSLHQIIGRKQLWCLRAKTMFEKQAVTF